MDIEESDDGDDGQRRGANQRGRATVYVKQLALFVEVMLLLSAFSHTLMDMCEAQRAQITLGLVKALEEARL